MKLTELIDTLKGLDEKATSLGYIEEDGEDMDIFDNDIKFIMGTRNSMPQIIQYLEVLKDVADISTKLLDEPDIKKGTLTVPHSYKNAVLLMQALQKLKSMEGE